MRLLFDQNLSPRLKNTLRRVYPNSLHVRDVGLEAADDMTIWQYAGDHGLTIVSKDSAFRQLSFTLGLPPRVCVDQAQQLLDFGDRGYPQRQV